jgi:hypothetical protein
MSEQLLVAYHGDPAIKEKYVARVRLERERDNIVRGTYGQQVNGGWRGCAVGCTIRGSEHSRYETELGIPQQLAHIEDGIFESLPIERAVEWPVAFLESIPVGADLRVPYWQFLRWLLVDPQNGVVRFSADDDMKKGIEAVAALYERLLAGEVVTNDEWAAAARAAAARARSKARIQQSEKLLELLRCAPLVEVA